MTNHYLVHWDGYRANLQASFERQFLAEDFVDVTLAVDSGLIKCHRVVLCAASAYFQQLLSQHNCPHPIIFMRDMQYWEVIALVDFMYRGEVSIEEDKLEPLMQAAQTLQIHGLSACLKACLERKTKTEEVQDEPEDSQGSAESVGEPLPEPQVELSTLSKLCEFNSELELRPITPVLPPVPNSQKKVVKEEIEFVEEKCEPPAINFVPSIKIQSVFSERPQLEKGENSDDCIDIEEEPPEPPQVPPADPTFRQFLLVSPLQQGPPPPRPQPEYHKLTLSDPPMYKRYSPNCLEQALRDLQTGRFRSIRACARHHGIPMTTLRYRAKGHTKRPSWMQ